MHKCTSKRGAGDAATGRTRPATSAAPAAPSVLKPKQWNARRLGPNYARTGKK